MSVLTKPYEVSLWEDVLVPAIDDIPAHFEEHKVLVIGMDSMPSQNKIFEPKLTRNVNGSRSFSFSIYYTYKDHITGEETQNPFCQFIVNERKIKLHYDDKWYNFIVKNIQQDQEKHSYTVECEDQIINELSKNGFNIELSEEAGNNSGSAQLLGQQILANTDWVVSNVSTNDTPTESDFIVDFAKEDLVEATITGSLSARQIIYDDINKEPIIAEESTSIQGSIYIFYSCCQSQSKRCQFIKVEDTDTIITDDERIILNNNCQYIIDDCLYYPSDNFYMPMGTNYIGISSQYRGKRFVYSPHSFYQPKIGKYVTEYERAIPTYEATPNAVKISRMTMGQVPGVIERLLPNGMIDVNFRFNAAFAIYAQTHKFYFTTNNFSSTPSIVYFFCDYDETDTTKATKDQYRVRNFNYSVTTTSILPEFIESFTGDTADDTKEFQYVYSQSDYIAPKTLKNYIANGVDMSSTSGWRAIRTRTSTSVQKGTVTVTTRRDTSLKSRIEDFLDGQTAQQQIEYWSYLKYTFLNGSTCLFNSGVWNHRQAIKRLEKNKVYILRLTYNSDLDFNVGLYYPLYTAGSDYYALNNNFFTIEASNNGRDGWDSNIKYIKQYPHTSGASVREPQTVYLKCKINTSRTEENFQSHKFELVFSPRGAVSAASVNNPHYLEIKECALFDYIGDETDSTLPISPDSAIEQALVKSTYVYYDKADIEDPTKTLKDVMCHADYHSPEDYGYTTLLTCQKQRAIEAKESNYYNLISNICETFECWADYKVEHDSTTGAILSKTLNFHNYAGKDNYAGLKYGVNVKNIQRTDDSKQLVTKLIVKDNTNEFGKNGFCTISRAPSNLTGDNVLYNFDHYINNGLLSANDVYNAFYGINNDGYYQQLNTVNAELANLSTSFSNISGPMANAQSELTTYTAAYAAAVETLNSTIEDFTTIMGYNPTEYDPQSEEEKARLQDENNIKYVEAYITACQKAQEYGGIYDAQGVLQENGKLQAAQAVYDSYKKQYDDLIILQKTKLAYKASINKKIYTQFASFIQEGTWTSEDYYDDEKYYLDSQSTLYNSSRPQISYNISALELSNLENYEGYAYDIGDLTFIEDGEIFGYDDNGDPVRVEIVVTEIVNYLDSPDKNTIKVQTYKNQFEDLFKKITATVQSVQYSTGAYNKAAALAMAEDQEKSKFLQGALNDEATILQNLGDQTVKLDNEGLTITDGLDPNKALRAVSKGILLTEDGGETWALGLTANGMSARLITAGTINTGVINIMNGNDATFLWDAFGITAYDRTVTNDTVAIDHHKGVRMDRFGLYGFSGIDGSTWHPTSINDIRHYSNFGITANAFWIKGTDTINTSTYTETSITSTGISIVKYYDLTHEDVFKINDNGDLAISGEITARSGYIGNFQINTQGLIGRYTSGTSHYYLGFSKAGAATDIALFLGAPESENQTPIKDQATFFVRQNGTISATAGTIGGWTLIGSDTDKRLYSGTSNNYVALDSGSTGINYAIWAGATNPANAPFSITRSGMLKSNNADITGLVTSTGLSASTATLDHLNIQDLILQTGEGQIELLLKSTNDSASYTTWKLTANVQESTGSMHTLTFTVMGTRQSGSAQAFSSNFTVQIRYTLVVNGIPTSDSTTVSILANRTQGSKILTIPADITIDNVQIVPLDPDTITLKDPTGNSRIALESNADIIPNATGALYLGSDLMRWSRGYINTIYGTINSGTSDQRLKHNINYDISSLSSFFDALQPASFAFNELGEQNHLGFIAQDVEIARDLYASQADLALVEYTDNRYYLHYNDLHALEVYEIQQLKKRVAELESKLKLDFS